MPARRSSGAAGLVRWRGAGAGGRRVVRFAGGNSSGPGGAAAFRGRGLWPWPLNRPAAGLARQRAGGLRPPAAAPPAAGISTNAKKVTQKPGPTLYGAWLLKRLQEGAGQRSRSLGQSRCPCPTGSGGLNRSAAGYRRKPTAPAVARLSPSAQDRVAPRSTRGIISVCGGRGRYWF